MLNQLPAVPPYDRKSGRTGATPCRAEPVICMLLRTWPGGRQAPGSAEMSAFNGRTSIRNKA
jgi:hypothetical protein